MTEPQITITPDEDTTTNPPAPPATPPSPPAPPPPGEGLTPEATAAELAEARRQAAKYRTERNEDREKVQQMEQRWNAIAKAFGVGDEVETDPAKIQSQLEQEQVGRRQERLENLVLRNSIKLNADPELTWSHLFASGALNGVDISSAEAATQVSEQVQAAMEAYPKLKADYGVSPPPPAAVNVGGGSNPPGGGAEPPLPDKNPWAKETFNLTEQWAIMQADKDLADRLRRAAQA